MFSAWLSITVYDWLLCFTLRIVFLFCRKLCKSHGSLSQASVFCFPRVHEGNHTNSLEQLSFILYFCILISPRFLFWTIVFMVLGFSCKPLLCYCSLLNYVNILKHNNQFLAANISYMHNYHVFLTRCGLHRVMGNTVCVTHPVTVDILLNVFSHFNLSCLLHVCMHAAFLVALFSFVRISNLVPYSFDDLSSSSNYFRQRKDVSFTPTGAILQLYSNKQFNVVSALVRFLYYSFLTPFCAPALLCLVIYALCQRLQICLCFSF